MHHSTRMFNLSDKRQINSEATGRPKSIRFPRLGEQSRHRNNLQVRGGLKVCEYLQRALFLGNDSESELTTMKHSQNEQSYSLDLDCCTQI